MGALEEHTTIHSHHQVTWGHEPLLQAQHCHQQRRGQAGTAAQDQPADGLDLHDTAQHSMVVCQAAVKL